MSVKWSLADFAKNKSVSFFPFPTWSHGSWIVWKVWTTRQEPEGRCKSIDRGEKEGNPREVVYQWQKGMATGEGENGMSGMIVA